MTLGLSLRGSRFVRPYVCHCEGAFVATVAVSHHGGRLVRCAKGTRLAMTNKMSSRGPRFVRPYTCHCEGRGLCILDTVNHSVEGAFVATVAVSHHGGRLLRCAKGARLAMTDYRLGGCHLYLRQVRARSSLDCKQAFNLDNSLGLTLFFGYARVATGLIGIF